MKVNIGQWVRTKGNKLYKVKMYPNNHYDFLAENTTCMIPKEYITKVKDTPRELIEIGDLVALDHHPNYIKQVLDVSGSLISFNSSRCVLNQVCKILTPNSNGGYDLQWEKNN